MKLGILGGMGPMATVHFYERIVKNTPANSDQEHLDTLILSHCTMPDRTSVIKGADKGPLIEAVKKDIEIFEKANVELIGIPCNTFHYFYDDLTNLTDIKVVNMVEEATKKAGEIFKGKIGVLGTKGTLDAKVYKKYFDKYDISYFEPNEKDKDTLMEVIYDIKSTNKLEQKKLDEMIDRLIEEENLSGVILACTELSIAKLKVKNRDKILDALDVLTEKCVE